ncbi:MAG TPA: hypothetical protein VIH29_07805 [Gallionella sp.]
MIGPGELLAGWNLIEKLGKLWDRMRGRKSVPAETIVTRFIRLFESHGVHRNQIPRFIGHGLTLKDVQDDASLLAKLDEPLLEAACEMFAVRREWLDGAELQVHPCHDFYKYPEKFGAFLIKLMNENFDAHIQGVLIAPEELGEADALLILQESIGFVGDKPIYRYHLCHNWLFTYWKARAYLTACVAIAWKGKAHIHGVRLPKKEIEKLAEGMTLLGWKGEGIWEFGSVTWHPEDMALEPGAFLKDVDPEIDNFGIKSALNLWLDLEEQGLMDTGMGTDFSVKARQLFQRELEKY